MSEYNGATLDRIAKALERIATAQEILANAQLAKNAAATRAKADGDKLMELARERIPGFPK
jgi:hypothetical protein